MLLGSSISFAQVRYPVHGTVQVLPPYGLYLSDYYGGIQDRLIVTLLNRDLEQPLLQARLRVRVKNGMNFSLESRDEIVYPILELSPNVPLRLTSIDIAPYLQPDHIRLSGRLDNGRLPVGMTEFSVQVVEYHTGRPLSAWHTGRAWLDIKNPPILNHPRPNEVIPYHEPFTQVQFQWMPRHQGVSGTEYEFVLKELPDNGVAPQSAFAHGIEIYRTRQRQTRLSYSVMQPLLEKNKRYGWQVRAVAVAGIDEIGMFANNGFTEVGWFEVRETVSVPTGLTGNAGYGKVDLKWNGSPNHQGYIIQYHPITAGDDEWIEARSYDTFSTLNGMKPGVKYEIRVGAYGSDQRTVFCSPIEVTIPSVNEIRLAECGKGLNLPERIQNPINNLQVGDTITIGPDFKMVATELHALGDGWYSGKGSTLLTWIFESRIAVHFDRLRVNVQREQIDGEVFTDYDAAENQIANSDRIDDGGSGTHGVEIEVPTTSVDFVMPDMPEGSTYDATTGSLTVYDTNGEVHNVPVPKNESGEPTFPMLIKDASGQTYEVSEPDESTSEGETSDDSTERTDDRKKKGSRPVRINKVEQITDFNREGLDSNLRLTFSGDGSRYAFDDGKKAWYKSAVKLDSYYKSLDKNGYITPWKLIPVGEKDVVKVTCSDPSVDTTTVRFVSENGDILPAKYDKTNHEWRLELPSVESGEEYAVYGLVDGKTAGKLRVISYQKQRHEVTLVQTNDYAPDVKAVENELNAIYNPIGIEFTVHTDTLFSKSWDLNGDGLLSIEGKTLFGKSVDVKESKEMRALQRLYASTTKREGICIFSLDGEQGVHTSGSLLGEMPRNSRFGYVFTSGSPDVKQLAHTIAHELGHGLFTLQHTFDDEYGGTKSQGTTDNLMDYGTGTDLVAYQWNLMSKPAIFTALDKAEEGQIIGTIARISGVNNGIAPNGQVISSIRATNPNNMVVPIITQSSMFIVGFEIYDEAGSLVKTFNWNNTLDGYTTKANEGLGESKDIEVLFNVAKENLVARIYEYLGDKCFYRYADVSYNPVSKQVLSTNYVWTTGYLWDANESCKANFIQQQILERERTECDSETIKSDKYRLSQINQQTTVKDIVSIVNSCCLSSLRALDYKTISSLILQISSGKSIEDPDELALLRLMNALNGEDYPSFFNLLEANNNALIRRLVSEMNDASLLFWTGNNYTNFIGGLVWMFRVAPEYSVERWSDIDVSEALGQVFNLYSQPYTNDIGSKNPGLISLCEFRCSGRYNEETGRISIVREEKILPQAPYGQVAIPVWTVVDEEVSDLSPLTPIVITTQKDLPPVEIALGEESVLGNLYIVPAIFLKYKGDKELNDTLEKSGILTLDAITIAASGPIVLATKVSWIRRLWALAEVAGSVGNIAVNTQVITNPKVQEIVDVFNGAMGIIGLKNLGQGGYKFIKNLPSNTKRILQENKNLRKALQTRYLSYRTSITKLKNSEGWAKLSTQSRNEIIKQEEIFEILADANNIPNNQWGAPDDVFINGNTKQSILSIPKGKRPLPETYLSPTYIDKHLESFYEGGSYIVPKEILDKYGRELIGRPDNNQFIMSKSEMDALILKANGNISVLEAEHGIPTGVWQNKELIRVDVIDPRKFKLRMPTGNEAGANDLWIPGGLLPNRYKEAIINRVPVGEYAEKLIKINETRNT